MLTNFRKHAERKGLENGMKNGMKKGVISVAIRMKSDGEPVERIMRYTGLSHEEIEGLAPHGVD